MGTYLTVFEMFYHASRELGHFSHWTMTGDNYDNHPAFIKDSWASFVGYLMTNEEFPNTQSSSWIALQTWINSNQSTYNNSPIFIDLYDDYNQQAELNSSYVYDDITGYNVDNLYMMALNTLNMVSLKQKAVFYKPSNVTESQLSALFFQY